MSTQMSEPAGAGNGHAPKSDGARVYSGPRMEDIIRQIRGDLGPDAIILRQREGLTGGVGGFFQQRFFEVEAALPQPRIDVYDDYAGMNLEQLLGALEPSEAPPADRGPVGAADLDPIAAADLEAAATPDLQPPAATDPEPAADLTWAGAPPTFAQQLAAAEERPSVSDRPQTTTPNERPKPARRPRRQGTISRRAATAITSELASRGLGRELGESLVVEAAAHGLAFTPDRDPRAATRDALARRIPVAHWRRIDGMAIAFVGAGGAGKTRCAAALAAAYHAASTLKAYFLTLHSAAGTAELTALLERRRVPIHTADGPDAVCKALDEARAHGVVAVDTPTVSPADPSSVLALAAELGPLALDAVLITLPATLSGPAAEQLLAGLRPLTPTGLAITHADETDQLGIAVELACRTGMPIAYIHDGMARPGALAAADPARIAARLLP